ncbi:hypothetical protein [Tunturiibacter gelidiferens]|uniref:Uncharacterized protein n=1 Tax=Tunturiibacter gelidiferens TaxID=3069689 RepID=A0AAU7Z5Y3_9BACT
MLKSELKAGNEYAFREKRVAGDPLARIRLIEHIRGNKWKAQWIDTHPGLVDYVTTAQILVPWKEHKLFLQEETDFARLREYNSIHGYEGSSPVSEALQQVFESVGEGISYDRGILRTTRDWLNRLRTRCQLPEYTLKWPAFAGRDGVLHLPHDQAAELARSFCMVEPAPVLIAIEATERNWSMDVARPGHEYLIPLLNQYRASWAIIRQWCGSDAAVAERDKRIEILERLVWDAIYALQKAGLDSEAARLRRTIESR